MVTSVGFIGVGTVKVSAGACETLRFSATRRRSSSIPLARKTNFNRAMSLFLRFPVSVKTRRTASIVGSNSSSGRKSVRTAASVGKLPSPPPTKTLKPRCKVLVGGGLGSLPTEAAVLTDFLPEEELLPTIEAVLRVFTETGNRKNKLMARLKFVLRAKGIEEFRRLVAEKRKVSQAPAETFTVPSPIRPSLVTIGPTPLSSATPNDPEYDRWAEHNLMSQRQTGYGAAWIKLPAGTFHSKQVRGLADVLEKKELTGVRIAVNQDLVIPWVPFDRVREIYDELGALDLAAPGARTISDVTGCPGATTCNLGITRSLTLAEVLSRELNGSIDPEIQKLRIKISGCPNSCGHHHIADIGFYGNVRKVGEKQAPYYQLLLGGKVNADGVQFARQIMAVPARPLPAIIRQLLAFYQAGRQRTETFSAWVSRTPAKPIKNPLPPFSPAHSSTP